jgi:hypothetical protein
MCVLPNRPYSFIIYFISPPCTGSYKSFIHFDGTCLVHDRSNPLRLLRLQPPRIRTLRPSLSPIHHLLYSIPRRRILRGLPHLHYAPRVIAHPRLAILGSGNVETNRLLPGSDVFHLVAWYVPLFPSIFPSHSLSRTALYVLYTHMIAQRRKVLHSYKLKGAKAN